VTNFGTAKFLTLNSFDHEQPADTCKAPTHRILAKSDNPEINHRDLTVFYMATVSHLESDRMWILTISWPHGVFKLFSTY